MRRGRRRRRSSRPAEHQRGGVDRRARSRIAVGPDRVRQPLAEAGAGHLRAPRRLEASPVRVTPTVTAFSTARSRSGATPRGRRRSGRPVSRRVLAGWEALTLPAFGACRCGGGRPACAGKDGTLMFTRIWSTLRARRAAMLEAEALVYRFGSRGVEMVHTYSCAQAVSEERREHYRRVARIAERRNGSLEGLDVATQYTEMARWLRRHGNLIGGGHPAIRAPSPTNAAGGPGPALARATSGQRSSSSLSRPAPATRSRRAMPEEEQRTPPTASPAA